MDLPVAPVNGWFRPLRGLRWVACARRAGRVTATRGRPAACRVPWSSVSGGEVGDENVGVLLEDEGGAEHVQLALSDRDGGGAFQAVGTGEHDGVGAVRLDEGDLVGEVQRHDD